MRQRSAMTAALLAAVTLLPWAPAARAQGRTGTTATTARRAVQEQYSRFIQAYMNRNAEAARAILTPDFRGGRGRERVDRNRVVAALQQTFGSVGLVRRSQVVIERFRLRNAGAAADATARHEFNGDITDPQGKKRTLDARLRYRDTWVRTSDGWKIKRSIPLQQRILVDGRPMVRHSAARPGGRPRP